MTNELEALRTQAAKDRLALRRLVAAVEMVRRNLERRGVDRAVLASALGSLPCAAYDGQEIPGA
jgi:hypothetical protein